MVFPGVQKTTWTYDEEAKAWYFHRFYEFQPDLNTSNPEVQAEILKIMGFWIQLGVSGFRMDAVPFIIGTKGADVTKPREQYDMLRELPRIPAMAASATRIILAEANVLPKTDMQYFGDDGDRMHMMFNFQVNQNLFYALAAGRRRARWSKAHEDDRSRARRAAQWGIFLRNHDELDLGRLTEKQRQTVFDAFGPEHGACSSTTAASGGGSRRCCDGDRRRLELAYSLMFTLPGTPVMRYGDELGMGDDLSLPERDVLPHADAMVDRAAWRLHQERQAGRSGDQRRPVRLRARQRGRAAARPEFAAQLDRAHHPHAQGGAGGRLGRLHGDPDVGDAAVLAMRYDWRNNSVLFLHNFDGRAARDRILDRAQGRRAASC